MDTNREIRKKATALVREDFWSNALAAIAAAVLGGAGASALVIEVAALLLSGGNRWLSLALTVQIILSIIIGGMVELGCDRRCLRVRKGEKVGLGELFAFRRSMFKALTLRLLICGEITLRLLLLIVPGVMAAFQYALAPYLMAQNPSLEPPEAIKQSSLLMKGYKERLLRFYLGYFGLFLLSVLTFGIGFIFLIPCFKAGMTEFYAQRIAEHDMDVRCARAKIHHENGGTV